MKEKGGEGNCIWAAIHGKYLLPIQKFCNAKMCQKNGMVG